MANNYFQFRQFIIQQDQCAMKVCTDACIFGAYVVRRINTGNLKADHILDIGTGTGLLSLMTAQHTNAIIDAIEIDGAAFQQAKRNFDRSPWSNRLNIFNRDAMDFQSQKKYDCIIINPPFFEGDLKSGDQKKNAAKHDTTLTLEQLVTVISKHLSGNGFFAVLLPFQRVDFFIEIAGMAKYYLDEQLAIQHTPAHPFFRAVLFFSRNKTIVSSHEMAIKTESGSYTASFIDLLKEYYLYL